MYHPKKFEESESKQIENLINEYSFATIISTTADGPFVSHIPLILKSDLNEGILIGHMARANPHWKIFSQQDSCYVIFHGPHTYVTPSWYTSGETVPTWNYAVVHVEGRVKLKESFDEQVETLKKLTTYFEKQEAHPYQFQLPEDLEEPSVLTKAIVSFEIKMENVKGKFKLSQNKLPEDKEGVIKGLIKRTDEMSQKVLKLMQK